MKTITLVILAMVTFAGCHVQNQTPAKTAKAEKPKETLQEQYDRERISMLKLEAKKGFSSYNVAEVPIELPDSGNGFTWKENLTFGLKNLTEVTRSYGSEKEFLNGRRISSFAEARKLPEEFFRYRIQILGAYGLLQTGGSYVWPIDERNGVSQIFKNPKLREAAYRWAMPSVKIAFRRISLTDRRTYLDILQHAGAYAATFNQRGEDNYLAGLKDLRGACAEEAWQKAHYTIPAGYADQVKQRYATCAILFADRGPDGKENPYRKIEAFIYRRIACDHWSKEDVQNILRRTIAELSPLL